MYCLKTIQKPPHSLLIQEWLLSLLTNVVLLLHSLEDSVVFYSKYLCDEADWKAGSIHQSQMSSFDYWNHERRLWHLNPDDSPTCFPTFAKGYIVLQNTTEGLASDCPLCRNPIVSGGMSHLISLKTLLCFEEYWRNLLISWTVSIVFCSNWINLTVSATLKLNECL